MIYILNDRPFPLEYITQTWLYTLQAKVYRVVDINETTH